MRQKLGTIRSDLDEFHVLVDLQAFLDAKDSDMKFEAILVEKNIHILENSFKRQGGLRNILQLEENSFNKACKELIEGK